MLSIAIEAAVDLIIQLASSGHLSDILIRFRQSDRRANGHNTQLSWSKRACAAWLCLLWSVLAWTGQVQAWDSGHAVAHQVIDCQQLVVDLWERAYWTRVKAAGLWSFTGATAC